MTSIEEILGKCSTCDEVNTYLIKNVEMTPFEDEDDESCTAEAALNGEASALGFTAVLKLCFQKMGVEFEIIKLDLHYEGVKVGERVYCPYVEKICMTTGESYEDWITNHSI